MFRTAFRLPFRPFGIPIHFDVSFLIVLPLLTWMIGTNIERYIEILERPIDANPLQEGFTPYLLGLTAAIGLFASVIVHELGHSVVGMRYGMKIRRITLWILGGMAQFEALPRRPGAEAVMAIAGPITSFAVGGVCWAVLQVVPPSIPSLHFVVAYLMYMNVILGGFNLMPALPLDGGRVLRSLLAARMPWLQATRIARDLSRLIAIVLGIVGFISLNVFLMLIALFVYMAVSRETQMAAVADVLRDIRVEDVMTREVRSVPPDMTASQLKEKMLSERHLGYPVVDQLGKLVGLITLEDIKRNPEAAARNATVKEMMSRELSRISPHATALEAFREITQKNRDRLVVADETMHPIGIISKTDLVRMIQIQTTDAGARV